MAEAKRKRTASRGKRRRPGEADSRDGFAEGMSDAARWLQRRGAEDVTPKEARETLHRMWSERYYGGHALMGMAWKRLLTCGRHYAAGFLHRFRDVAPIVPVPLRKEAAAIVCTNDPNGALPRVLTELDALPLREVIVVVYGEQKHLPPSESIHPTASVVVAPNVSDPDVGRALGARLAASDMLLFVSGEKPVAASVLARFLWECDGRADIALSDLSMRNILFRQRGSIAQLQEFLNASLNRPDLKSNSLTALPYALSRKALDTIGAATLCVPAKAHAVAILSKLRIVTGGSAGGSNALTGQSVSRLAAGDHAEAWHAAIAIRGGRLTRPDLYRNRAVLGDLDR
ncbi:hypothetical protein [Cohnella sp. GCM10027633]|uniref:hypothetical protein n=1 Tax=unclassified Cohnella TaxID=2636738 RepID=UPI0036718679